jgi:uncharacterized protein
MSLLAILLFIGTMALSLWATIRVRQAYNRFSLLPASSGSTGADTAATILRQEGISEVEIVAHDQMLGDHYDPIHKRVVLSRENFYGTSVAALGVAAHECGHAIQHKYAYAPLQWRMASVGLTTFANQIVLWLPLLGMFIGFLNTGMALILMASAWGILMLFNLLTLRRIRRLGASAPSAAADRLDTDGGRRDGAREGIKCSSLDLCCRVHYVARLLFAARVASARGTQRVIQALP